MKNDIGLQIPLYTVSLLLSYGIFWLGVFVAAIPQVITFIINYYLLNTKNPVEAVSIIAGGRSANPALSEILDKTENAPPMLTTGYAMANNMLTIWGPVIVQLMKQSASFTLAAIRYKH